MTDPSVIQNPAAPGASLLSRLPHFKDPEPDGPRGGAPGDAVERARALTRQVHELRLYGKRLHATTLELGSRLRHEEEGAYHLRVQIEALRTAVARHESYEGQLQAQADYHMAENAQLRAQVFDLRCQCEHLQTEREYLRVQCEQVRAQAGDLATQNYLLRVQLSAFRHRLANRLFNLLNKVPGLPRLVRATLQAPGRLYRKLRPSGRGA
jgi:hypothetical protein